MARQGMAPHSTEGSVKTANGGKTANRLDHLDDAQVTNGGKTAIDMQKPYLADITVVGVAPLLFHAWNIEAIDVKGKAPKGSDTKKTDDVESYVYRTTDGVLGVPGVNLHGALCIAAKSMQDPRSPRKSLRDLVNAGIISLDPCAPFHGNPKAWDYIDRRRVTIKQSGITRSRPAMKEGWKVTFRVLVNTPEYITEPLLSSLVVSAGRLVGLCDHRPTYGRFSVNKIEYESAFEN
jgi:hypothetical protein